MITTFEQAKKLKELGFSDEVNRAYWTEEKKLAPFDYSHNFNESDAVVSAPTVSDALQWIRDKYQSKGIYLSVKHSSVFYYGEMDDLRSLNTIGTDLYNSHPDAESKLLTLALEYLEQKLKK